MNDHPTETNPSGPDRDAAPCPRGRHAGPASDCAEPGGTGELVSVDELTNESQGTWLVFTRHTTHCLDLDHHIYERRPGPDGSKFPFDFTPVRYSHIETHPQCGARMLVWFDDPTLPDFREHYRFSSPIRAIICWARNADPSASERVTSAWPASIARPVDDHDRIPSARRAQPDAHDGYPRIGATGSWRVATINSDYLIDLDAGTATRTPLQGSPLRGDGRPLSLLEVVRAEVGGPLILRVRHQGTAVETVRYGTTVLRIEPK
ncbi:hypothetical protein ACXR8F_21355 [Terrabacter sp. AAH1]